MIRDCVPHFRAVCGFSFYVQEEIPEIKNYPQIFDIPVSSGYNPVFLRSKKRII